MELNNKISEELRSLSVVIDEISRQMPYGLPEGYFDDFSKRLLRLINGTGGIPGTGEVAGIGKTAGIEEIAGRETVFQVPEGYFEGFAGNVLARIKAGQGAAGQAAEAFKPLAGGSVEVSEELAMLAPLLSRIERKAPYQVPEGYFGELVPILAGLQHKPLYGVPEGYFDGLAGEIAARVATGERESAPAKVISFGRRGWWKYSAAAVVAGLILTIGWLRLHTGTGRNGAPVDIAHSLYTVSDQEIQNYLDNHNNVIPPAEQDSILNSTATLNVDENDVKSLLGDVPDGELKQYLEEHGGTKDAATN
jgi:hypothetical protein